MKYIIGIDEVGRGSIAGPVTVAALALPRYFHFPDRFIKDSKQLSEKQRERWLIFIKKHKLSFAVVSIPPQIIDKINISRAANLAALSALKKLIIKNKIDHFKIYLDAGLYLNNLKFESQKTTFQIKSVKTETVIKGDEKISAIALASIVAKVHRDRLMKLWHKKLPVYGFHHHKGYGTKEHFRAIQQHGPSRIHRLTFLKKYLKIK